MKRITCVAALAASLTAQANVVPGLDGRLTLVDDLTYYGRRGPAHPNGEIGMAMLNEMCNPGTVQIPWQAAMQPNHPKFGFLIVRVAGDRIEQISDRSFCKHAFTSTNYSGPCGSCMPVKRLGVGTPISVRRDPSVPPRTGTENGSIPVSRQAWFASSTGRMSRSSQ